MKTENQLDKLATEYKQDNSFRKEKTEAMKTVQVAKEKREDIQSLFDNLCSHAGFGDLKPDDRSGDKPLQRQAVWCVMREQGVIFMEIAKQSHRTHGTVFSGVKRFKGFLSVKDEEAVQMYQNVIKVAQNGKE